jgi:hypothetical protein
MPIHFSLGGILLTTDMRQLDRKLHDIEMCRVHFVTDGSILNLSLVQKHSYLIKQSSRDEVLRTLLICHGSIKHSTIHHITHQLMLLHTLKSVACTGLLYEELRIRDVHFLFWTICILMLNNPCLDIEYHYINVIIYLKVHVLCIWLLETRFCLRFTWLLERF